MFLDSRRKPEFLEKTHADTGRTYKLRTESLQPDGGFESRAFLLRGSSANRWNKILVVLKWIYEDFYQGALTWFPTFLE